MLLMFPLSESNGESEGVAPIQTACNCIAFRLDDVQDHFLDQAQMEIIRTFEARNTSLTVGVIGNHIGDDYALVEFLKQGIDSDSFNLEVANHGWDHEDFSVLGKEKQSELLSDSNAKIFDVLGVYPSVFITPYNLMNGDTPYAMAASGLNIVSAGLTMEQPPFTLNMTDPARIVYHFPATTETGDFDDTQWIGYNHTTAISEIRDSISRYGYAVVMMHPQEHSVREGMQIQNTVDEGQLQELELLLDSVRDQGYKVITISELANYSTVPEFSDLLVAAGMSMAGISLLRKMRCISSRVAA